MRSSIIFLSSALVWVGVLGCGSDSAKTNEAQQPGVDSGAQDANNAEPDASPEGDGKAGGMVGDPCVSAETCPAGGSGNTVCKTDWPSGGYCAVEGCTDHGHDCPNDPGQGGTATTGGKCVLAPTAACLALCATDTDCREGYSCQSRPDAAGHGSANVCVPKESGNPGEDGGMADGGEMGADGGGMGADGGGMGADGGGMGADGGGMGADGGGMGADGGMSGDGGMMGGGGGM